MKKIIMRTITFSQYPAYIQNSFIQLSTLPFRKLVIHIIAIQMYKYTFWVSASDVNKVQRISKLYLMEL